VPGRTVDDALEAAVEFESGAVGTIEATRLALGRRNAFQWEINGSKGSLAFDMERLNELQVFRADGDRARGFKTVLVSRPTIRSGSSGGRPATSSAGATPFVHEAHHLLQAIATDGDVAPYGATFEDGYRASEICRSRSCARARAGAERPSNSGCSSRPAQARASCSRVRSATDSSSKLEPVMSRRKSSAGQRWPSPQSSRAATRLRGARTTRCRTRCADGSQLGLERPRAQVAET
jgi:hypothetical protein